MTIGPAPMIMMVWMSTRLGIQRFLVPPPCGEVASASARAGGGIFEIRPPPDACSLCSSASTSPPGGGQGKLHASSHFHMKTPSRARAGSASPAERPLLDGILERLTALHRFGPCLLEPVVPYRRHICVLNQHLRRRKFKPLILQFHDSPILRQKFTREGAEERLECRQPGRVPIENLRHK